MDQKTAEVTRKYFQYIQSKINATKHCRGSRIFNLHNNWKFEILLLVAVYGAGFLCWLFLQLPMYMVTVSIVTSLFCGFVVPRIVHALLLKSKGKIGKKYRYLQSMYYFSIMKDCFKMCFPQIVSAKDLSKISDNDLHQFAEQAYSIAQNFYEQLNKKFRHVIVRRDKKDEKKINKILQKAGYNLSKKQKIKIEKIVKSNTKYVSDWCELFNEVASDSKTLFQFAKCLGAEGDVPNARQFYADAELLQKKYAKYTTQSCAVNVPCNLSFGNESVNQNHIIKTSGAEMQRSKSNDYTLQK